MKLPHSRWEEAYKTNQIPWRKQEGMDNLLELAQVSSGVALDLGCGSGDQAFWLAENGFEVEAVDYSQEGLKVAQRENAHPKISYRQWDLENLADYPFEHDQYDLILSRKVIAFLENREQFLATIAKKLRGTFVLQVFLEHDEAPVILIDEAELHELLWKYFSILTSQESNRREGIRFVSYYLRKLA